jgi:hypothetical protein
MELVSPELALVDPLLARRARALLPPPRDCLAPRALARPPAAEALGAARITTRSRPSRPSLLMTVLALQLVTLIGSLHLTGGQASPRLPAPPPLVDRR